MSRTALVTGGSGFLGSHIADELTRRGWGVRVFDHRESPYLRAGQKMCLGDVRDEAAVGAAADGCQVVFHLAALAELEAAHDRAREAAEANILGTVNALEAARSAGAERFMLASTVYVYSRAGGFYRCSKQAAEAFTEEYGRQFGLPYTILRYGSLYGPRAGSSNGVLRLLAQAARTGSIKHTGSPDDVREYVHVEDAARLTVDGLGDEFADSHLTVTGHHPMRLEDLFTMFSEILGREIAVDYLEPPAGRFDEHYRLTPYAFSPRVGRKLTSNHYVDMGQGILQLLAEIHEAAADSPTAAEEPDG